MKLQNISQGPGREYRGVGSRRPVCGTRDPCNWASCMGRIERDLRAPCRTTPASVVLGRLPRLRATQRNRPCTANPLPAPWPLCPAWHWRNSSLHPLLRAPTPWAAHRIARP